jgi:hypothetical protein
MPIRCRVEDGIFEITATGVVRAADVAYTAAEEELYFATPGCSGLILIDATELKVVSPDGAEVLVELMMLYNPQIVRSAFVIGEGTAALQLGRLIRDAGTEKRRTFTSLEQALAWLRSPLSAA